MVKWIREGTTDPEVGVQVQDQMSKKEILKYSVMCVVEGVGMRVCKEGATWKIRWEDRGDGKRREGRGRKVGGRGMKVGGKKALSCSFLDPPEKPSPCFFNNTPKKRKIPF